MSVQDWSTNADQNTSVDGINIGEHCPARNLNDAIRAVMSNVKADSEAKDAAIAGAQASASTAITNAAAAQTTADSAVSAVNALSADCVKISGNQTISGTKTFTAAITASGGVKGNCTGNAATATKLQTARTINGVSFNGTANITVKDSTKLALDGSNLSSASQTLTTAMAHAAMPSSRFIDYTPAYEYGYVMPADGFFMVYGHYQSANSQIRIEGTLVNGIMSISNGSSVLAYAAYRYTIPVSSGMTVVIYGNATIALVRFTYAEGAY